MDKLLIRKDVYDDFIEKGYGKKDYSKLTKKVITDKNGHRRTVFVRNTVQQTEQKQPTKQELSDEKRARYEEMLEKVKEGPEENALFVSSKGMLNKKEAIAHLEEKLGKKSENRTTNEKKYTQNDLIENYLDAKNEGRKNIADDNRIDEHSNKAINLDKKDIEKLYKEFDYLPEDSKGNNILNILYDENKELYKKLADQDIEYKKLHPEAEGKTFSFDLAQKFVEDAFNEYKKNHVVGKDRFAEMSIEEIKSKQQELMNDYKKYYADYQNKKNDGSKIREYFKKFDVYRNALEKKGMN